MELRECARRHGNNGIVIPPARAIVDGLSPAALALGVTQNFRERVRSGEVILGAFIKSAAHQTAEVLGHAGLDFAVIDAEHAPFGVADIDRMVLGARSTNLPCLVRPADLAPSFINQCLDMGAAGILAPHIIDAAAARAVVSAARYDAGQRGFSPSTRAGGFGTTKAVGYRAAADRENSLWCQIEDAQALQRLDEIAKAGNVDCFFVGRADLALSLGVEKMDDPKMRDAIAAIAEAARRNHIAFGLYIGDPAEFALFLAMGATVFVCGSDQSYLMAQARAIRQALSRACESSLR